MGVIIIRPSAPCNLNPFPRPNCRWKLTQPSMLIINVLMKFCNRWRWWRWCHWNRTEPAVEGRKAARKCPASFPTVISRSRNQRRGFPPKFEDLRTPRPTSIVPVKHLIRNSCSFFFFFLIFFLLEFLSCFN